jgi:predicted kinase
MLVGLPGTGKSTWVAKKIRELHKDKRKVVVISSDAYIEAVAKKRGKTYDDVFDELIDTAQKITVWMAKRAVKQGWDVIWDQTNLSAKSRAKKLAMFDDYQKVAYVFTVASEAEHLARLWNREGKTIGPYVMAQLQNAFQMPTSAEGFQHIRTVRS